MRTDTVAWLEANGIPCDILLFNKDKWDAVYQSVYPATVVAAVDDRDKHAIELAKHHVPNVLLMDRPWNTEFNSAAYGVHRVTSWDDILTRMRDIDWGRRPPSRVAPEVIAHDPDRCQADVPNGHSFMSLGGRPGRTRCSAQPAFLATEDEPGEDGRRGSMSLCASCRDQMIKQGADSGVTFTPLN